MHPDLYPYQRVAAGWLAKRRRAILGDEMGVGKTPSAIAAADVAGARFILCVVPGIACENWKREFHAWQTVDRSVAIIQTEKDRPDTDVVIASYAMARRLRPVAYMLKRRWDLAIVDEAQLAKSNVALVTRCLYGNDCTMDKGILAHADRVWLLSGGLMLNHAGELWTHISALFPKIAAGRSYQQWVTDYCKVNPKTDRIVGNNKQTIPALAAQLAPHILRRSQKQVVPDLPPLRISQIVVNPAKLPPKSTEVVETEMVVRAAIQARERGLNGEAKRLLAGVEEIHLASLVRWTGVAKAPAIGEYLVHELMNGLDRVVIFANHREVFDTLLRTIPYSVAIHGGTPKAQRQRYIDGFQGKVPGFSPVALICHIRIASTALTLTAANRVEFAEQPWVPLDILQAAKRCHRIGQTRPVLGRIWSLAGSIDELIGATLTRKVRTIRNFNDALAA